MFENFIDKYIKWGEYVRLIWKKIDRKLVKYLEKIVDSENFKKYWKINKKYNILYISCIIVFIVIFINEKMWLLARFNRFLLILLVIVLYSIIIRYFGKNSIFEKKKEFFKRHYYLNGIGLFIYKWSHIYFLWLEIKVMIINILRVVRYIFLKMGKEEQFRKIDVWIYLIIYVVIEKIFNRIIEYINEIKSKILFARKHELLKWRMLGYMWVTYLIILGIAIKYIIIIAVIYIIIKMLFVLQEEFKIYFTRVYHYQLSDNRFWAINSHALRGRAFDNNNISGIEFRRFILDGLYVEEDIIKEDVYKFGGMLADSTYFSKWYEINGKDFSPYCIIDKESIYWYKNEYYFKDVMGGLKLVYVMNFCYILRDIIIRIVYYRELLTLDLEDLNVYLREEDDKKYVVELLEENEKMLEVCKEYWKFINREEINNGQKYIIRVVHIINTVIFWEAESIWIKLEVVVDNKGIKSMSNREGNEKMLEKFKIVREGMKKYMYKENALIEKGILTCDWVSDYLEVKKYWLPVDKEDEDYEKIKEKLMIEPDRDIDLILTELSKFLGKNGQFQLVKDWK